MKISGHLSDLGKDYSEFKLQYNKHSVDEVLIQRAVKTNIQKLYNKGLFHNYANTDKLWRFFIYNKEVELIYQSK